MFHLLVLLLALIQVLKEAQHSIVISSFQGMPSTEKGVDKVELFFQLDFICAKKKSVRQYGTFYLEICLVGTKHCLY